MKKIAGALGIAGLIAAPLLWTGVASAGAPPTYDVTPLVGPAGTTVTATGTGCDPTGGYEVFLYWFQSTGTTSPGNPGFVVINDGAVPETDGTFSATGVIPLDAEPGTGDLGVQCLIPDGGGQATQHFPFLVTQVVPTAPATTAPADVADTVAAAPAFTG